MIKSRILTLVVTFVLLCLTTACNLGGPKPDYFPEYPEYGNYPQNTPHYSERVYVEPDEEAIYALYDEILAKAGDKSTSFYELASLRNIFYVYYYEVINSMQIAQFEFYRDYSNKELRERNDNISNLYNELNNSTFEMEKAIFSSQYKDKFIEIYGQDYYDMIMDYEVKSEEILALEERITALTSEYDATEPTAVNASKLGQIYIDLVNARNELARKTLTQDGVTYYKNYMDYAYAEIYGRSYTPDQIHDFRSYVIAEIIPVSSYIYSNYRSDYGFDMRINDTVIKQYIPVIIKDTAPQMINSWNYMMQKGLYDFDFLENKLNSAFVSDMYAYGDAFMFVGDPTSLVYSLNTVIHEFGHYNAVFATDPSKEGANSSNYDLLETHSQAFELITLPAVSKLIESKYNKQYKNSYIFNLVLNMSWASLFNSAVDEFEYVIYNADPSELTYSFIYNTFKTCLNKYWKHGSSYNFYEIHHIYSSPAYCISYAVSAIFSAEIWSQENATQKYLEVVSYGGTNTLAYVCEQTGLSSPLLQETIVAVADHFEEYLYNTFRWEK